MDKKNYIYKSTLLQRKDWTEKAIKTFLPQHDKEVKNPKYKSAAPSKLYELEKVEAVENSEGFKSFAVKNHKRILGAIQAVSTKYENIMDYVNNIVIEVLLVDKSVLVKKSIEHYNSIQSDWHYNRGGYRKQCDPKTASINSDDSFLRRITINYLRHQLTNYENELSRIYGKVGNDDAYTILKERINQAILDKYEWLKIEE